jgi:hypothetical protein
MKSSLQCHHLPSMTEFLHYDSCLSFNFPLSKDFLSSCVCLALCHTHICPEEADVTLSSSGQSRDRTHTLTNYDLWCDDKCCKRFRYCSVEVVEEGERRPHRRNRAQWQSERTSKKVTSSFDVTDTVL